MNRLRLMIVMSINLQVGFLFFLPAFRAYGAENKIILVEEAEEVELRRIREISEAESQKAADGNGYLANENVVKCFAVMKYHYTGGRYVNTPIHFRLKRPWKIVPGRKYPLVVSLHGAGEGGNENTRQLAHIQYAIKYLIGPEAIDFFCLAPQCPGDNDSWGNSLSKDDEKGDAAITIVNEIIDTLVKEYPIDANRISLFGLCSGGHAAWQMAFSRPDRFAAIAVCSTGVPYHLPELRKLIDVPIWTFNNADDMTPIEPVRQAIASFVAEGGLAALSERPTGGHDSWGRALRDESVYVWLTMQDREKDGPPPGLVSYRRSPAENAIRFVVPLVLSGCLITILARSKRHFVDAV